MSIQEAIKIEQGQYLHRNSPVYTLINLLSIYILAYVFRDDGPPWPLMLWVAGASVLSVHRLSLWHRFRGKAFTHAVARHWLRIMVLGPGAASALWAGAVFLIVPALPPGQQYVFLFAFVLFAVTAVFNYSAYYPTYLCVFLPFGIAVVVAIATGVTTFHPLLAGMLFLFVLAVPMVAWRFNRIFLHSLALRFENLELVEQLRAQKEAAETAKETAEAANLAKSRFLAAASHDLRQPMHAINLYLGTLAGLPLQRRASELLTKARQCGCTMDEMFRALLDMSRLDAAAVQPDIGAFAIAPVLQRIHVQFEPEARAKGLALRVVPCAAFVRSDVTMLETVLRNLVANAVRYTDRGRILIGCRRRGGRMRVAVYDTGRGIPADKRRAVFEEFYQLHNPERDHARGLGLGLAIVERLVRLLGATIDVASQEGRGSMFAVDVPCADAVDSAAADAIAPTLAERTPLTGISVAVIDDEEAILDATRALLEQWGCRVVTAASGREALERLAMQAAPDVIVCDYRLRGEEDGMKVVGTLRSELGRDIPAVFITGDTAPGRIREIQTSGVPVLYKPIEGESLQRVLRQVMEAAARSRSPSRISPCDTPRARPAYDC